MIIILTTNNSIISSNSNSINSSPCPPPTESGIPEKCPTGCKVHGAALQTIREADDLRVGPCRQGQYASHGPHTQVDPDGLGAGPQAH